MNQSELEANTCVRRQARENESEKNITGLDFNFWLVEKVARVLLANHRGGSKATKANANYFHSILKTAFNSYDVQTKISDSSIEFILIVKSSS